mgnify:CR=1 FL=1
MGTLLYRGRPEDGNGPYSFFGELTSPPVEAAKENRMSPYGSSMDHTIRIPLLRR